MFPPVLATSLFAPGSTRITPRVSRRASPASKWPGFTDQDLPGGGCAGKCGTDFEAWENDSGPSVIGENKSDRRRLTDNRLVVNSLPRQSAVELCEDPRSHGPEFVSVFEGTHCNMYTREALPLCGGGVQVGCFDLDAATADGSSQLTAEENFLLK